MQEEAKNGMAMAVPRPTALPLIPFVIFKFIGEGLTTYRNITAPTTFWFPSTVSSSPSRATES